MNMKTVLSALVAAMMLLSVAVGGAAAWAADSDIDGDTGQIAVDTASDEQITVAIDDTEADDVDDVELRVIGFDFSEGESLESTIYEAGAEHDETAETYVWDVNESDLSDAPQAGSAGGMAFEVVDTSGDSEEVLFVQDVQGDFANGFDVSAVHVGASDDMNDTTSPLVSDTETIESDSLGGFLGIGAEDTDTLSASGWTEVDGDDTTVNLHLYNDAADAMDDAAVDADEGDLLATTLFVNADPVLVYADEAPEELDGHTVAVYDSDSDTIEIELGEEHEGAGTVTYDIETHDGHGFNTVSDEIGVMDALSEALSFPSLF